VNVLIYGHCLSSVSRFRLSFEIVPETVREVHIGQTSQRLGKIHYFTNTKNYRISSMSVRTKSDNNMPVS
jgi:hypothetical protein